MRYIRNPFAATAPFDLADLKLHARVDDDDDDANLTLMGWTAAGEIEARTELALLAQSIAVTLDCWGDAIPLPVGPFYAGGLAEHPVTVQLVDGEGNATAHPAGWWIEPGRRPVLHLTSKGEGRALIVTYPAGYGVAVADIPHDLRLAVNDEAARLYDMRGAAEGPQGMSLAAARIIGRYKAVRA
ncbi:hypothetical protein [Amaricoccus sp. W119]|uniref:head-tail connector protein n=1 Tax=Amaricoccus sp. W119 TaxID=3391833 RepID=UPI0039A6E8D4